jgi:hypothetical protein
MRRSNWMRHVLPALLVACAHDPQRACPETAAASSVPLPAAPDGKPPFNSVSQSDIEAHRPLTWHLQVTCKDCLQGMPPGKDNMGFMRSWEIAEARAGDVPMPPGSTWKCRFNHGAVWGGNLIREVQCSSDGWRTHAGDTANAWTGGATGDSVAANVSLYEAERWIVDVQILPCRPGTTWVCLPAPELP